MKKLILILPLLAGCSFVSANRDGFRAYVPAYPWQDSTRVIEKMNVSTTGTNRFTASVRGLNESETIGTNAANLLESTARGTAEGLGRAFAPK